MVNSGHLANPVSQNFIVASEALLQWNLSSLATLGTAMKEQSYQQNAKNTNEQQLFLQNRNGNIRSSGKPSTRNAEEGYGNDTTQSEPPSPKYSETYRDKTKKGLDKRGNKRSAICIADRILQKITRKCIK